MNKKIIAAALAIVFIATTFTACKFPNIKSWFKKDIETMKIGGREYPVYRDENGDLVYNEENDIAVLVTDRQNNEVVTYEDGEPQTYWLPMDKDTVHDSLVQGSDYTLKIPSGWEGSEYGRVFKKRTDEKCYIEFRFLKKVKSGDTLDSLLKTQDDTNDLLADALKDEEVMNKIIKENPAQAEAFKTFIGTECTYGKSTATITKDALKCAVRTVKIVNASGELVQYSEDYYFIHDEKLYTVRYACIEGEGYDDSFSFSQYLSDGFTFKPDKKTTESTTK